MKDKEKKKKIKSIAQQISQLENKCRIDSVNQLKYMAEMQQLIENLSLEELLEIDEYIIESKCLKK
jgi:hypothetical protein